MTKKNQNELAVIPFESSVPAILEKMGSEMLTANDHSVDTYMTVVANPDISDDIKKDILRLCRDHEKYTAIVKFFMLCTVGICFGNASTGKTIGMKLSLRRY